MDFFDHTVANFPTWWYHTLQEHGELAMSSKKSSSNEVMNQVIESVKARVWITYDEASETIASIGASP